VKTQNIIKYMFLLVDIYSVASFCGFNFCFYFG